MGAIGAGHCTVKKFVYTVFCILFSFYFLYFSVSSALIANWVAALIFFFEQKVKLLINWEDVIRILLNFLSIFSICQSHDQEGWVECRVALDPGL